MDPKTVTLCDGVYCWDCEVNDAYKAYEFKRTFGSGVLSLTLTVPVVYLHIFFLKWPISAPVLLFSYALALLKHAHQHDRRGNPNNSRNSS